MKAQDVMTRQVATISPDTPVAMIATFLLEHAISAAPVIGATGEILGVVSEGDLLQRAEIDTIPRKAWWLAWLASTDDDAREFIKTHGVVAADVMTRGVIAVHPETPLVEAAALMEKKRIKRVFVTENGKLAGVITRTDLVRALVGRAGAEAPSLSDAGIREEIERRMRGEPWASSALLSITVHQGRVELGGAVESQAQRAAIIVLARGVPGVQSVVDYLVARPVVPSAI